MVAFGQANLAVAIVPEDTLLCTLSQNPVCLIEEHDEHVRVDTVSLLDLLLACRPIWLISLVQGHYRSPRAYRGGRAEPSPAIDFPYAL